MYIHLIEKHRVTFSSKLSFEICLYLLLIFSVDWFRLKTQKIPHQGRSQGGGSAVYAAIQFYAMQGVHRLNSGCLTGGGQARYSH